MKYLLVIAALCLASCSHTPKKELDFRLSDSVVKNNKKKAASPAKATLKKVTTKKGTKVTESVPATEEKARQKFHAHHAGEKFVYKLHMMGLEAGSLTIKVGTEQFEGEKVWKFSGHGYTSGLTGNLYDLNASASSLVDYASLFSLKFSFVTEEKTKRKERIESYSLEDQTSLYYQKTTETGEKEEINEGKTASPPAQDILSTYFALRNLDYSVPSHKIPVVSMESTISVEAKVLRTEKYTSLQGAKECWVVGIVIVRKTTPIKATLWISKDDSRIIYKIESPVKLGTARLELTEFSQP